jgi:NitT/TauT family transport system permease protein
VTIAEAAIGRVRRFRGARRGRLLGPGAIGLAVGLAVWEVLGRTIHLVYLPPASAVGARLITLTLSGEILGSLATSLSNLAFGLAIALIGGIALGILTGLSRVARLALDPYINALLTAPSLVFAPIFFSIWGLGRESIVALIVTYSLFVVVVNTSASVRAVSGDLVEMATSFNATSRQRLRWVVLPAATPLIFAGVRVAVARAVKGMINGEMFIALLGLGKLIEDAQHQFDATTVIAVLTVVVIVALALMLVVDWLDARVNAWLPSTLRAA